VTRVIVRLRKPGYSRSHFGGWYMSAGPTRCAKCNGEMVQVPLTALPDRDWWAVLGSIERGVSLRANFA
jgi:hypothetical protein